MKLFLILMLVFVAILLVIGFVISSLPDKHCKKLGDKFKKGGEGE